MCVCVGVGAVSVTIGMWDDRGSRNGGLGSWEDVDASTVENSKAAGI